MLGSRKDNSKISSYQMTSVTSVNGMPENKIDEERGLHSRDVSVDSNPRSNAEVNHIAKRRDTSKMILEPVLKHKKKKSLIDLPLNLKKEEYQHQTENAKVERNRYDDAQ